MKMEENKVQAVINAQIEALYENYIANPGNNDLEAAVANLSRKFDGGLSPSSEDLAEYEEAVRHAAFYAGMAMAADLMRALNS